MILPGPTPFGQGPNGSVFDSLRGFGVSERRDRCDNNGMSDMNARIYQPTKTAMQSGRGNTKKWLLEYKPAEKKVTESLMGWIGSGDMRGQLRLRFATKEEAVAYAERHAIPYTVTEPRQRAIRPKSYADNFKFDRIE